MNTNTQKLSGKIALVTGGSSGIGLATAKRFVAEGAYVFITGRRQTELDGAGKEIGSNVTAIRSDVGNLADLDRLFDAIKQQKARLDILFANAGGGEFVPLGQVTEAHFDKYFGINVKGTLFTVQKALPLMPPGAAIVINGSMVSIKGYPGLRRLRRDQGSAAVVRPHVVSGSQGPQHSSQCGQPRNCHHARLQKRARTD